ncbi:MAG: hypothetical protein N2044_13255, partial [Cyclobacteriaceae bacterium]|nr:hypothetical protein [Cyclobacteriaceae bacterium]
GVGLKKQRACPFFLFCAGPLKAVLRAVPEFRLSKNGLKINSESKSQPVPSIKNLKLVVKERP